MTRADLLKLLQQCALDAAETAWGVRRDFSHLTEDTELRNCGLDSLALWDMLAHIEREQKIQISDEAFRRLRTIKELLDLIEAKRSA